MGGGRVRGEGVRGGGGGGGRWWWVVVGWVGRGGGRGGGGGGGVVCVRVCVGMEGRWWLWVAREVCVFACVVVFRRL